MRVAETGLGGVRFSHVREGPAWRGSVFLWGERSLYVGAAAATSAHAAHEIKVCVALAGSAFRLRTAGDPRWRDCRTAIIPPHLPHQIDGGGEPVCLIYFPPEVSASERLARAGVCEVPTRTLARALPRLRRFNEGGCEIDDVIGLCGEFVEDLCGETGGRVPLDPRVARVLERLKSAAEDRFDAEEFSNSVALSQSRLAHLFREQVGVALRGYALELRLRRALVAVARGRQLTRAAHDAGFADSAHLSRTFRRMIGLSPTELTRNSRLHAR